MPSLPLTGNGRFGLFGQLVTTAANELDPDYIDIADVLPEWADDWRERYPNLFPNHLRHPFSQPHAELLTWADEIELDTTPRPFVAIWPRGRGKSTIAELVAADLGARGKRKYCIYVCETQDQADKHIATIKHVLESEAVTRHFPAVGNPRLTKSGSRTWNRRLMIAENNYSVEAIGLDKAVRGQKIDWVRPDLIILDDIDSKHDTENAVIKKQGTLTTSILPAGADNAAVLFVQNLIHVDSIAHKLSKKPTNQGAADYLADRVISGPHKAVEDLTYEFVQDGDLIRWQITGGRSLWSGFSLEICEAELNREGPTAFELESQHEIDTDNPHALLTTEILSATRVNSAPDLVQIGVAVDPSGGSGQCGIIGGGRAKVGRDWHGFTLVDASTPKGTPSADWAIEVLRVYHAISADAVIVERNFGGDMAANTIKQAKLYAANGQDVLVDGAQVKIVEVTASRGKEVRAEPVAAVFQQGRGHHVGHFPFLEKQWTQWVPGSKPSPDRLDSEVWLYTWLKLTGDLVSSSDFLGLGEVEFESPYRW